MDIRQSGFTPSTQWREQGITWAGTLDGETVTTLHDPAAVLAWMRQQAVSLRLDRSQRGDPLLDGDRGKAMKLMASQGCSVQFRHDDGTLVRAEARHG